MRHRNSKTQYSEKVLVTIFSCTENLLCKKGTIYVMLRSRFSFFEKKKKEKKSVKKSDS